MFAQLLSNLKYLRDAFFSSDSSRQLAAGVVLGLFLGLIPKGNILAIGLSVALCGSMANLGTGMITAIVASFVGQFTDPFAHEIGIRILTMPLLSSLWQMLATWPVVPWTRFNNTVVMGNLVLATALAVPAYRLSLEWFGRKLGEESASETGETGEVVSEPDEPAAVDPPASTHTVDAPEERAADDEPRPVERPPKPPTEAPEFEKTLAAESAVEPTDPMSSDLDLGEVTDSREPDSPSEMSEDDDAAPLAAQLPEVARADAAHPNPPAPKSRPRRRGHAGQVKVRTVAHNGLSIPSFDILPGAAEERE